ncbi:GNAT family N-acetyltransferase [Streptomyces xiamenensis]|uniref:GNAT family N-acetyltransferase n=1 Tax=Streptomyces xiamenensis TaxID=408015 RepID=UPI0037D832AA
MSGRTVRPRPAGTEPFAWSLRAAGAGDVEPIAELRAVVMRADLERLGRYDGHRVRQRLRDGFSADHTSVIEAGGAFAGCVTLRGGAAVPDWELEHFYLAPEFQGCGLGTAVLGALLARGDAAGASVRLTVLRGSAARRLYERHGFTVTGQDSVDVFMLRRPAAREG